MAEKKSFMIYLDNEKQVNMLTDEQAGKLFKALFEFAKDGTETDFDDGMIAMAFSFMTDSITRDTAKYNAKCEKNKAIALEREANRRAERERQAQKLEHERARAYTNITDIDKDKDKDIDKDIDKDKDKDIDKDKDKDIDKDIDKDKDKDIDKDKEIDINKRTVKPSPAPPKSVKKKFGEYGNISLTDEQYSQLVKDYGESVMNDYIRRMDEYIQMKGKKYKDFNLALRNWIKKDGITKGNDSYGRINKGLILE